MNIAIFIHGKASSGKDTFVKALKFALFTKNNPEKINSLSYSDICKEIKALRENASGLFETEEIVTMPFADEVRKELCRIDPSVDYNRLCKDYDYKAKYRKQLVEIGNGYRKESPGIWIDKHYVALKEWNRNNKGKIVCIPDMRYATNDAGNEFEYACNPEISNILTLKVKIKASLLSRLKRMSPEGIKTYVNYSMYSDSENAMDHIPEDMFDFVCVNSNHIPDYFNSSLLNAAEEICDIYKKIKNV